MLRILQPFRQRSPTLCPSVSLDAPDTEERELNVVQAVRSVGERAVLTGQERLDLLEVAPQPPPCARARARAGVSRVPSHTEWGRGERADLAVQDVRGVGRPLDDDEEALQQRAAAHGKVDDRLPPLRLALARQSVGST